MAILNNAIINGACRVLNNIYGNLVGTVNGYTIAKSVPSSAVFTDTDTKVTSVSNHYTPTGTTTKSASGGTATNATGSGNAQQVVTGVTVDAAGHVTAVTSKGIYSTDADHITTATTSGSGNAVTAVSADANGALTVTKGTTFLTSHQDISGKADKSATVSTVAWDSTNKKLTKTINGTTSDVVTGATILGGLTKSQVTTALGYTPPTADHDHITTATTSGSGNAVTAITADANGALTVTKGTTFLTSHQDISGKANLASPALTGTPTAPTAANGTNTTQIATTAYVMNAFQANDAMVFKGTIGSSEATVTALPNTHYQGWTYKVITAGTYAGKTCEIGDMIICVTDGTAANNDHWTVVQSNIDGAVTGPTSSTGDHVATFNGTTGKVIKDSGYTIAKSVPSDAKFTDTVTTASTSGSGNAVTAISASNGALTVTKGTTFLTSHQDISGKADKSATVSTVAWDTTNKKLTKTINGTTTDVVTGATILGGLTKSQVTTALGYTPPTSDTNTWNAMTGATSSANGTVGYVNAVPPKDGYNTKYLRADGTWSVPPDNNTDTKVTAVGNHYTPAEDANAVLSADASSSTAATWGTTSLVTGVDIKRDAKGHVTGVAVDSIKMPGNPNSNTTYTFANGTNGFTVTPSGGSAQTVTVTPSITNNVTGSGTSGYIAKFNGANTITNGPAFGSDTTKFLRNDGTWVALSGLPTVSAADNGKFLQVVNGAWAVVSIPNANGVSF